MGKRRALLIGVKDYGEGLDNLPSADQDVTLMDKALRHCGYEVTDISSEKDNATQMLNKFRGFCEECEDGDIHIIYFSGHGISIDKKDYIIPAGVKYRDAKDSDYDRIKTDLSDYVGSGLVVFIIDACRHLHEAPIKGTSEFGYEFTGGPQFMRFFGCSYGEVCQVIPAEHKDQVEVSLFSKVLATAILGNKGYNLNDALDQTTEQSEKLVKLNGQLKHQKPHLNYGETTTETQEVLKRKIFDPPPAILNIWKKFDPNKMHCLLVLSEIEAHTKPKWSLEGQVKLAMEGKFGRRIWEAFQGYGNGLKLLNGKQRKLPKKPDDVPICLSVLVVKDAFEDSLYDEVVRGLVEADLVIFDVTDFEPGMMLLMGIRSASRRGVGICTHGSGWHELETIETPFNLRDVSLGSHTERESSIGKNRVINDFVNRIELGFQQLDRQPRYQDLPAYDALRQLGPNYDSASTIPASERILALTSYGKRYNESNWDSFQNLIEGALDMSFPDTQVLRLIDDGNPQLVSQSLYELIRRSAGCIVDWTEYSPSTFFELGVRLAVSERAAIQFVDKRYLPGGEEAEKWGAMSVQIEKMRDLFNPLSYDPNSGAEKSNFKKAAKLLSDYQSVARILSKNYDQFIYCSNTLVQNYAL